ncbi:hypothetical protein C8R42DRAFT_645597 [Lentinula raphanica]|nr:hypothetical protein C8R42DRAFT_645597 [Lentinula raphanica]
MRNKTSQAIGISHMGHPRPWGHPTWDLPGHRDIPPGTSQAIGTSHLGPPNDPRQLWMIQYNCNWPESTHLVYPKQQRTISITAQQQCIKDVLQEAILFASGLAIFQNAFASSDKQFADSKNSIISAAQKHEQYAIVDRLQRDRDYAKHLITYVTGRVRHMRGKVKEVAQELVPSLYSLHLVPTENDQRKKFVGDLFLKLNYIFPRPKLIDATSARTNEPYLHPGIAAVLNKFFFSGKKALGRCFEDTFTSSSEHDDSKEIPQALLGLVSVAWDKGKDQRKNQDFVSSEFNEEYELHIMFLRSKILKPDGSGKAKGSNTSNGGSAEASKLPEIDFDGMEE